jgi:hypothetical protein
MPAGARFIQRPLFIFWGDYLFAGAALQILQTSLAQLRLLALRLADDERTAANVFGFVKLIFCQVVILRSGLSFELLL